MNENLCDITPKKTPLRKSNLKILTKRDVLSRFLYELKNTKNVKINQCSTIIVNEILAIAECNGELKYIRSNMTRDIKKLYFKWSKIKIGKKRNKSNVIEQFNKELNSQFKFSLNVKKSNNKEKSVSEVSHDCDDNDKDESTTVDFKVRTKKLKLKHLIDAKVTSALDRSKVSTRNAVHIIAATAQALDVNLNNVVLNRDV